MSHHAYGGKRGTRASRASSMLDRCGYAKGGAVTGKVTKGVHEHEKNMHKGKKETKLHLKHGGRADGDMGKHKLDKYASGGKVKSKGTTVNVIVAGGGDKGAAPMPPSGPPAMPMRPPMPPAGGPPPMGAPGMKPPMKRGGRIPAAMKMDPKDGGAGSGLGRLEKARKYGGK